MQTPLPPLPDTVTFSVEVDNGRRAEFARLLSEFHSGPSAREIARAQSTSAALDALHRLYAIACRDSGQCRDVAAFLAGLYNGYAYPFNLTDLRGLDENIYRDCLLVLELDARNPVQEIHLYLADGNRKFQDMIKNWQMKPVIRET